MAAPDPRRLAGAAQDISALVGAGCITHGVDLVCRPAAYVVVGTFLMAGAWMAARRTSD